MTQTFATNDANDIYIGGDGNLAIARDVEAVKFACETAARAILAEMIYAQSSGIPYFESVWVGSPNYGVFRKYLRDTLLGIDGVTSVTSLSLAVESGVLYYNAVIQTQYGPVTVTNG